MRASRHRGMTGAYFLLFREEACLDYHLYDTSGGGVDDGPYIFGGLFVGAVLYEPYIDHHIDLRRAVFRGFFRLKCLGGAGRRSQRETDDGADCHA